VRARLRGLPASDRLASLDPASRYVAGIAICRRIERILDDEPSIVLATERTR
jgi:hypothetical protein